MKPEDKQIVFQDLCARLPYGVCVELSNHHLVKHIYSIKSISMENGWTTGVLECAGRKKIYSAKIEDIKPYLRPMSSMTEEEKKELKFMCDIGPETLTDSSWINGEFGLGVVYKNKASICVDAIDWLNKNMFDYRGLIPRGCAIAVTEDNNPYAED